MLSGSLHIDKDTSPFDRLFIFWLTNQTFRWQVRSRIPAPYYRFHRWPSSGVGYCPYPSVGGGTFELCWKLGTGGRQWLNLERKWMGDDGEDGWGWWEGEVGWWGGSVKLCSQNHFQRVGIKLIDADSFRLRRFELRLLQLEDHRSRRGQGVKADLIWLSAWGNSTSSTRVWKLSFMMNWYEWPSPALLFPKNLSLLFDCHRFQDLACEFFGSGVQCKRHCQLRYTPLLWVSTCLYSWAELDSS